MNGEESKLTKKEQWELRQEEKIIEVAKKRKSDLMKRIALWAGVAVGIAAVAAFIIWFVVSAAKNSGPDSIDSTLPKEADWVQGPNGAPVVLIEYGDFQCPACGTYHILLEQLQKDFEGRMQFVYRHFPLKNIHKNAVLAASAAEAAGKQGKFWEIHDILFEKQSEWAESDKAGELMAGYASGLGLNLDQFKTDLNSQEVKDKVEKAYADATAAKITSTPTFFLNGQRLQNPKTYDEFKTIVQGAIDSKSQ